MVDRWSVEQVLALAPDAASAEAGRGLADATLWRDAATSAAPAAVWGLCQGSGKNPYRTIVDLAGPAYRCSCPSRKFPCKHALGLLLSWSAGAWAEGDVSGWAAEWLDKRISATDAPTAPRKVADPVAARRRADRRAQRVATGLDELDRWLRDQVRTGLAGSDQDARGRVETIAARMVDAQAPAVASVLRELPGTAALGEGWAGRLLAEYARLRLLGRAHGRLAELPAPMAATVRAHVADIAEDPNTARNER